MLRSILSSMSSRRVVVAGLAAVSVSLAACGDAAAPTAPPSARGVDGPNKVLVDNVVLDLSVTLTARIVDIYGQNIPEAGWIKFARYPYAGSQSWLEIQDNTAGDLDPALGVIKVKMLKGESYEACHVHATKNYTAVGGNPTYPTCRYAETSAFSVDMGKVYARKNPRVTWSFKDEFGNLLPGATLDVTLGNWNGLISDGDGFMDSGYNGTISFKTNEVSVSWCEVKAPYKYAPITNKCGSFAAKWEKTYAFTIVHEKLIY